MSFYYNLQFYMSIICALAEYVLIGIAFMKLAKNRGMGNPWLAWIPFANVYLIGAIADQTSGQQKRKPRALGLLILSIAYAIAYLISRWYPLNFYFYNDYFTLLYSLINLVASVLRIAYIGFLCISLYDIFKAYTPYKAGKYIIISILSMAFGFSFVPAILIMIISENSPFADSEYANPPLNRNYQPQQNQHPYQQYQHQASQQPYQSQRTNQSQQPFQQTYQQSQPQQKPYAQPQQNSQDSFLVQNDNRYDPQDHQSIDLDD